MEFQRELDALFVRLIFVVVLVVCILLQFPTVVFAQEASLSQRNPLSNEEVDREVSRYLSLINQEMERALEASRMAVEASTIEEVKRQVDIVFETVWGAPSGITSKMSAVATHGWKTRWQSDTTDFELETPEKFGTEPPAITDPSKLGVVGSGRYLRKLLWADSLRANMHYDHVISSLSNLIGWMRMDYAPARGGMPRVDLTYQWDAPSEFWLSTADTGWIFEVYAQAENILRTHYEGDASMAKQHARDLNALLEKAISGVDVNGNGSVEPVAMEGGLSAVVQHARLAGFDI